MHTNDMWVVCGSGSVIKPVENIVLKWNSQSSPNVKTSNLNILVQSSNKLEPTPNSTKSE